MDGAIKFNVSANTAQFDASMGRVRNVAGTTGAAVRSAFSGLGGLLAGGAFVAGLQNILQKFDDISDRAKRFGVTTDEIQKVGNAADLAGSNFETVARAMDRTGVAASKAAREGGVMAEAFARVGLDPAVFAAATLEQRIKMIAEAQRAANGDAAKMAELFEVIGVRAAGILFTDIAAEMGKVNAASADTVERLSEANDMLTAMKSNATIFVAEMLKLLVVDPMQKWGGFLGGAGFKNQEDIRRDAERRRAERELIDRGDLAPRDHSQPWKDGEMPDIRFLPNTESGRKIREEEMARQRKISEEVARQKAEADRKEKELRDTIKSLEDSANEANEDPATTRENGRGRSRARRMREPVEPQLQPIPIGDLNEIYSRELEKIRNSNQFGFIKEAQERQLNDQLRQAKESMQAQAMRDYYNAMAGQGAMPEAMRTQQAPQQQQQPEAKQDPATETTLQKVANFLEQLNTKLPQPVLV